MTMCRLLLPATAAALTLLAAAPADAQRANRYLGEIFVVANRLCPQFTEEANGRELYIPQNTDLYSLYGTTFGGNGTTTFALPDLRGRVAIGLSYGANMPVFDVGDYGGTASVSLDFTQIGPHAHTATVHASSAAPTTHHPENATLGDLGSAAIYNKTANAPVIMAVNSVGTLPVGESAPIALGGPYLGLRYCVVTQGLLPPRPPS